MSNQGGQLAVAGAEYTESKISEDDVVLIGTVMTREGVSTAGQIKRVDADGEDPYGLAMITTRDEVYWRTDGDIYGRGTAGDTAGYSKGVRVTCVRKGRAAGILAADNAAIVEGDPLYAVKDNVNNEGRIDIFAEYKTGTYATGTTFLAARRKLVGWAMEAADALAGATESTRVIDLLLDMHNG